MYVTRITDRSYIKVAGLDFSKVGAKQFVASVANGAPKSSIELHLDRIDGPLIGALPVGDTGAPGQWQEKTISVSHPTGVRDLYMVFKGRTERSIFDFDHWLFVP